MSNKSSQSHYDRISTERNIRHNKKVIGIPNVTPSQFKKNLKFGRLPFKGSAGRAGKNVGFAKAIILHTDEYFF